jgi:hypothetical protein
MKNPLSAKVLPGDKLTLPAISKEEIEIHRICPPEIINGEHQEYYALTTGGMVTKKQLEDVSSFLKQYCDPSLIARRDILEHHVNFNSTPEERDGFIEEEYGEGNYHLLKLDYQTTSNKVALQAVGSYIGADASPDRPATILLKSCFIFSQYMYKELEANRAAKNNGDLYKWKEEREQDLLKEILYHVSKLHQAIYTKDEAKIKEYLGDTLNYILFIAHKLNVISI